MIGWMIIFATLSIFGLIVGQGPQVQMAGYGMAALFGILFAFACFILRFSQHSS